jgi:hypothetical protein
LINIFVKKVWEFLLQAMVWPILKQMTVLVNFSTDLYPSKTVSYQDERDGAERQVVTRIDAVPDGAGRHHCQCPDRPENGGMTLGPIYTKPDFRVLQSRTTSSGKNEE